MLSPVLAYFFPSDKFSLSFGGAMGGKIIHYLNQFAGDIGTFCIMLALALITLILVFNPIFHLPIWHRLFSHTEKEPEDVALTAVPVKTKKNEGPKLSIEEPIPHAEPSMTEQAVVDEESFHVPESFWESETLKEQEEPVSNEIELDAEIKQPGIVKKTANEDLTLEVLKKEEDIPALKDAHISIASDEPYDPSLELRNYKYPTLDLLDQHSVDEISIDKHELEQNKNQIINTLKSFGIAISKISATVGPTVTLYEIVPAEGVRISKIRNLEDDIALSLSALGIRIIAPIPGKGTIGIEVPNLKKQIVSMRTLISSEKFINNNYSLPIALGKKIDNENYIVDLATMPHLLMAGATGQGKSVGINAILVSLLYKKHPSQVKFVMVDPKKVELSIYKVIEKHFLAKLPNEEEAIITDTKKVINTLNALCIEMDNRYDLLKEAGVRNIKEYNDKFIKRRLNPNKGHQYLPFIILVVDEFADLIMTAGKEVEMPIARLAQLARAVGIHLIIATQRPSVNVITGTIKANFPGRIAFRVSAKVDSRTILDTGGADQLIGRGDMLILNGNDLVRVQCAFVDTPEVERIVNFIGDQQGYPSAFDLPEYEGADGGDLSGNGGGGSKSLKDVDQMFEQCARLVVTSGSGSTSMLQRRFNLGYNRAGRIMDQLEAAGVVGSSTGGKPRELMVHTEQELEEILRGIGR
ncbi:DNA translocase FtsK [Filimonas sp.]|nr:DNA translocase FtsK [Filimonas sp.]